MNFVTYETAVRLKEAGFPQPKPMFYQLWYSPNGESDKKHKLPYIIGPLFGANIIENSIFAPTAEDILRELKGFYATCMIGDCCGVLQVGTNKMLGFSVENLSEALAEAWFEYFGK